MADDAANVQWLLDKVPNGHVNETCWRLHKDRIPVPREGELLVKALYISGERRESRSCHAGQCLGFPRKKGPLFCLLRFICTNYTTVDPHMAKDANLGLQRIDTVQSGGAIAKVLKSNDPAGTQPVE